MSSRDVKGTSIPIVPDKVVYTSASEPPGIRVASSRYVTDSPMWNMFIFVVLKVVKNQTRYLRSLHSDV